MSFRRRMVLLAAGVWAFVFAARVAGRAYGEAMATALARRTSRGD